MTDASSQSADQLIHESENNRYRILFAGGGEGEVVYRLNGQVLEWLHTEVHSSRKGQGLGGRLMEAVLPEVEARQLKIKPLCDYAEHYLHRHERWTPLLEDA